jgi:hypothetical protein
MSLLQGVLKSNTEDLDSKLKTVRPDRKQRAPYEDTQKEDSDDDLVNVVSLPGTPARTRPSSPTRQGALSRTLNRGPLTITSNKLDPLKAFPTELTQRVFALLSIRDLAKTSLVCKKWARSQSLNYVWFQHYRKENFHDDSLPPGKWTKRESKQNWRQVYLKSAKERSPTTFSRPISGYSSPNKAISGYQTPREIKEEQWKQAEESAARPGKVEMREMYKELGGRKARAKTKLGSSGVRDKGGWDEGGANW